MKLFLLGFSIVLGAVFFVTEARGSIPQDRAKTWRIVSHTFGPYGTSVRAFGVTGCETGRKYNRGARNSTSGTTGIFQIHPDWIGRIIRWGRRAIRVRNNLHGRWPNARYALFLSKGGRDWSPWAAVCRR
jgi:hypothetical protein